MRISRALRLKAKLGYSQRIPMFGCACVGFQQVCAYFCAPLINNVHMNRYETVFIMTPVLSAEQVAETVSKFRAFVTDKGGKIVHEDAWGLRKLAYPIQKKSTGFYHLMEFEADPSVILPFETEFRRDERIIRFLSTKMDKHHLAYAEGRRNKSNRQEVAPAEAEGTAEA